MQKKNCKSVSQSVLVLPLTQFCVKVTLIVVLPLQLKNSLRRTLTA